MYYFKIITLSVLLIFCAARYSFGQPDGLYIRDFGKELSANAFFGRKIAMLEYQPKGADGDTYTYMPNNSYNAGLGFYWKGIGLDISFGLPFFKNESACDTKSSDIQFYYYARKFLAGFFWQDYEGFYNDEDDYDRPDIKMIRTGIFGEYVFSGNKLSYKAAFNQSEEQLKSAGSFLLGGGFYYTKLEADYDFDDVKMASPEKQKAEIWQIGPSAGYGYTWVPRPKYYLTGAVSVGVNVSVSIINGEDPETEVFPSAFPKVSMGYNNGSWGINFIFLMNISFAPKEDDKNFTFGSGNFTINFVKRFSLRSDKNDKK